MKSKAFVQHYKIFTFCRHFLMASSNANLTSSTYTPSEIELVNRVHSHFPNNEPNQFHYFYETASPFSNFHPCTFTENGIEFNNSERYMMYHKASKEKKIFFFIFLLNKSCFFLSKNYSAIMKQLKKFFKLQLQLIVKL